MDEEKKELYELLEMILRENDICWVCRDRYGVDLPKCRRMTKEECIEEFKQRIKAKKRKSCEYCRHVSLVDGCKINPFLIKLEGNPETGIYCEKWEPQE